MTPPVRPGGSQHFDSATCATAPPVGRRSGPERESHCRSSKHLAVALQDAHSGLVDFKQQLILIRTVPSRPLRPVPFGMCAKHPHATCSKCEAAAFEAELKRFNEADRHPTPPVPIQTQEVAEPFPSNGDGAQRRAQVDAFLLKCHRETRLKDQETPLDGRRAQDVEAVPILAGRH